MEIGARPSPSRRQARTKTTSAPIKAAPVPRRETPIKMRTRRGIEAAQSVGIQAPMGGRKWGEITRKRKWGGLPRTSIGHVASAPFANKHPLSFLSPTQTINKSPAGEIASFIEVPPQNMRTKICFPRTTASDGDVWRGARPFTLSFSASVPKSTRQYQRRPRRLFENDPRVFAPTIAR